MEAVFRGRRRPKELFAKAPVENLIEALNQKVRQEIGDLPSDTVLASTDERLAAEFVARFHLSPLALKPAEAEIVLMEDIEVDVSWDRMRVFRPGTRPVVKGQRCALAIPFEGDPDLFEYGTYYGAAPIGEVVTAPNELLLYLETPNDRLTKEAIDADFKSQIGQFEEMLKNVRPHLDQFNAELPRLIDQLVRSARARATKSREVASNLAFPIRQKAVPQMPVAVTRKPLVVAQPPPKQTPNPYLEQRAYDEILTMLASMSRSMERTPRAFEELGEEFIRDLFLVVLNANFEGAATGETFSVGGKTDIFVPHSGGRVFIAECKFWRGPEGLRDTIDQLLGYLTWRETKTAVVLFVRGRDFRAVLAKIPDAVAAHPRCVGREAYDIENGFRFHFKQSETPGTPDMLLTLLAYDLPSSAVARA